MTFYSFRCNTLLASAVFVGWSTIALLITVRAGATAANAGHAAGRLASINSRLTASTYFGGQGYDSRQTVMARDSRGNLFVADWTQSGDLPMKHPSFDSSLGGVSDVFIAKFSSDLDSLLASTYLGGSGVDGDWPVIDLGIGPNDEVYVTGKTSSSDYPVSAGCFQSHLIGSPDVFVSILSNDLSTMIASTYLGGTQEDRATSLAIMDDGSVIVAGATLSANFPRTPGCFDSTYSSNYDVFITHLSASLTTVLASTLLGGAGLDHPEEVHLGANGDLFIGGWTSSSAFPVTAGAIQTTKKGLYNGFVTRMPLDLSSVTASTYLGGNSGWEFVYGLEYDAGELYVTGHTGSATGFHVTSGSFDETYNSTVGPDAGDDAFVCRLTEDLTDVTAGTYIGSQGWDGGWKVLASGSLILVSGSAGGGNFPLTDGAPDTVFAAGSFPYAAEGFFAALDRNLTHLVHSTFLGGEASDHAHDLVMVGGGEVCIAGGTGSADFPVTEFAYDTSFNLGAGEWGGDAFLTIIPAAYVSDGDSDAVADFVDNCPEIFNPDQADFNGDGIGDACCCVGTTGNVDCDAAEGVDIGDLTTLIDNLFVTFTPLCCDGEANADDAGGTDIGDLTVLIDNLFITFTPLPECQ